MLFSLSSSLLYWENFFIASQTAFFISSAISMISLGA